MLTKHYTIAVQSISGKNVLMPPPTVITAFSPTWSRCSCQGTLQHATVKHLVVVVIVIEIVVLLVIVIVVAALKKPSNILLSNMFLSLWLSKMLLLLSRNPQHA